MEYLDQGFEKHDEMLQNVSALFRKYYNLVRGHGHMNDELQKEHEVSCFVCITLLSFNYLIYICQAVSVKPSLVCLGII